MKPLLTADQLALRVAELGAEIAADYRGQPDLVLVGILRGSLFFLADLARAIDLPLRVDCIGLRSYDGTVGGEPRITADLVNDIAGASVIVVEDIVERGATLTTALAMLRARGPADIAVCSLLRKPGLVRVALPELRYVGFDIGPKFVVGYGLDHDELYRNLPYVGVLEG